MYCEIPTFKRCCCCLPLRGGLLGYAYFKLALLLIYMLFILYVTIHNAMLFYNIGIILIFVFMVFDASMTVAFVVGGHKKNPLLLKVYMWYAIGSTVLLVLLQTITVIMMETIPESVVPSTALTVVAQLYLAFLIRSEILKLESERGNVRYQIGNEITNINIESTPKLQNV